MFALESIHIYTGEKLPRSNRFTSNRFIHLFSLLFHHTIALTRFFLLGVASVARRSSGPSLISFEKSSPGDSEEKRYQDQFRVRRTAFYAQLKSKVGNILAKATALRINRNIDGAAIASRAHTHPSHSQTSRLRFTSLSVCTPFPS